MKLNPAGPAFLAELEAALSPGGVIAPETRYLTDPRGLRRGSAAAVARPADTGEVARLLALAQAARVAVIPYSGGTGLVGGQIADDLDGPVILSLERLAKVREVDPGGNVMVAEAGVILADARAAAEREGRIFPLSLSSEGTCRIGGNLATNAGGVQVLRYGNARDLCLGIEAVLADGTVIRNLRGLRKDNTGYDLKDLLVGSEGTLGVITAASLKLFPKPRHSGTVLATVPGPEAALDLLNLLRDRLGETLGAFELMSGMGLVFLEETMPGLRLPLPASTPWLILAEAAGGGEMIRAELQAAMEAALERGLAGDVLVAANEAQRRDFWSLRETIPLGNRRVGYVSAHDVALPLARIAGFMEETRAAIAALDPGLRVNAFGHLGDGNLHFNVFPARGRKASDYDGIRRQLVRLIHDRIDRMGGSFSAEHGIGRAKVTELELYGDPGRLAAMRAIKAALDPAGILNPGAVLRLQPG